MLGTLELPFGNVSPDNALRHRFAFEQLVKLAILVNVAHSSVVVNVFRRVHLPVLRDVDGRLGRHITVEVHVVVLAFVIKVTRLRARRIVFAWFERVKHAMLIECPLNGSFLGLRLRFGLFLSRLQLTTPICRL